MTMLFCDSFDHYTTIAQKWTTTGPPTKTITSGSTVIFGFAFRRVSAFHATAAQVLCSLREGATDHIYIETVPGTATIRVMRGGAVALVTLSTTFTTNVWYYVEVKANIHDTTGSIATRVNGADNGSFAGDTRNAGTGIVDTLQIGTTAFSPSDDMTIVAAATRFGAAGLRYNANDYATDMHFDDLYVCNSAGTVNNDFLGDVRIEALYPNGVGNYAQWTPSAGANWQNVDETTPNDETDYNISGTVNQIDTYAFTNLTSTAGSVAAVQANLHARKDDAGTRQIAPQYRSAAVDAVGATKTLSTSWTQYNDVRETDPSAAAWTIASVNAAEFGAKVIA